MNKYKSEIYEAIYEDALADYEVGAISEARMREYDKMCLTPEALRDNSSNGIIHKTASIEHAELATA